MQTVAAIFGGKKGIEIAEGQVVEGSVSGVSEHEDRDAAAVAATTKIDTEDRAPGATCGKGRNIAGVGIASGTEEESAIVRARQKLSIFRTLERSGAGALSGSIRIKRVRSVDVRVMHRDPANWIRRTRRMEEQLVR